MVHRYTGRGFYHMSVFSARDYNNHEQVVYCCDPKTGLKAIIAIHNTNLGPALGGCRMWEYTTEDEALQDVLRLSKGMTYKAAISNLPLGGGKAVIIGNSKRDKTPELMKSFARFVNTLGGRYITAEDVGMSVEDMVTVHTQTNHVVGLPSGSGDPSPYTAYGTFKGMCAATKHQLGQETPKGLKVLVQGVGHVGYHLCKLLHQCGAKIFVTDINEDAIQKVVSDFGATPIDKDEVASFDADIYAPCALGAVVNDDTIPLMKFKIIAGSANNQLHRSRHGEELRAKNILYTPDYVINAGGLINVWYEKIPGGYNEKKSMTHIDKIYDTLLEIFKTADSQSISTNKAADHVAEKRFGNHNNAS